MSAAGARRGWRGGTRGAGTCSDVLVVGGGPAGLHAAQLIARRGLGVRVLEEHDRIGEPVHCTGILGREAFDLPGVPRTAVLAWPRAGRFHSPAGHCLPYEGPRDQVCVVDRGAFDRGLADAAVAAGARIATGARAIALRVESDGVSVQAETAGRVETLRAEVCLLACGARYQFQRGLGWGTPRLLLSGAQAEVVAGPGDLDVFFRPETAPDGFAWLVPIARNGEPRAKVGVMARAGARRILARLLGELADAGRVAGQPGPVVVRPLPLAPLARTYGDRVLALGDAAGLVKATTGGGIYYSLLSAGWAAGTLGVAFERGDFAASTLGGYEETWRSHLGAEIRVGVWFRRLAAGLAASDLDALTRLALADGVLPIIRATARFNWHAELILQVLRHPGVVRIVLGRLIERAVAAR